MLNQATKDKLLSLLEIADNSKRYTALAAIEEATEISSDFLMLVRRITGIWTL